MRNVRGLVADHVSATRERGLEVVESDALIVAEPEEGTLVEVAHMHVCGIEDLGVKTVTRNHIHVDVFVYRVYVCHGYSHTHTRYM